MQWRDTRRITLLPLSRLAGSSHHSSTSCHPYRVYSKTSYVTHFTFCNAMCWNQRVRGDVTVDTVEYWCAVSFSYSWQTKWISLKITVPPYSTKHCAKLAHPPGCYVYITVRLQVINTCDYLQGWLTEECSEVSVVSLSFMPSLHFLLPFNASELISPRLYLQKRRTNSANQKPPAY